MAHDEKNEAQVGDKVSIVETRPLSARKTLHFCRIIEKPKLREDSLAATPEKKRPEKMSGRGGEVVMIQQETRLGRLRQQRRQGNPLHPRAWWHSPRYARVGDVIVATVKVAAPNGNVKKKSQSLKLSSCVRKNQIRRKDGSTIKFDDNAAVIIGDDKNCPRYPYFRPGSPRTARPRLYQDHQPRSGGTIMNKTI
jgi:large subunit ribosomal protein L14